jgi:metal-dependent hydrolase (beta-lactamase superfamily II)
MSTRISSAFKGTSQPQLVRLRHDLALLEYCDPGAIRAHMATNGFALLVQGEALLFDTAATALLPLIHQLRQEGFALRGLVLSHRHTAALGGATSLLAHEHGLPVLLYPADARHPQAAWPVPTALTCS